MSKYIKTKLHHRSTDLNITNNESHQSLLSHYDSDSDIGDHKNSRKTDLRGDYLNILLLLSLYILQGIPLGLAGSIPLLLTNRKVSYGSQAIFSFVSWPFSIKLLWAPIVDSVYYSRFGRRKTWLIPIQYAIAFFMLFLWYNINYLLEPTNGNEPNIYLLTFIFILLNFLAATQDIAVDGWALTMLSRKNVSYASTCNTVGQTAGYFLGNVVFLALESADFCNKYLRSEPNAEGLITISGFFMFWGIVFLVTTTMIMIIKTENSNNSLKNTETKMSVCETYKTLFRIFKLRNVRLMVLILMTCKIGFAVTDSATGLKLIEAGVHKENLALLAIPIVPLQIILPWLISKYTNGPKPLNIFLKAYPYRLLFGVVFAILLWWTKQFGGSFPVYYYVVIVFAYALHQITLYCMFVALMAFYARISDPSIGGTYMTLLNTITNLGGNWPSTISLWLIDPLTLNSCSVNGISCNSLAAKDECISSNGECVVQYDGYYIQLIFCVIIGFVWLKLATKTIKKLQSLPVSVWKRI